MRHQPCLCLCLGFSQIILILPFLLITLHFSQIGFTDDLTFTVILLSFVVRFPLLPETHRFRAIWKRHYGLLYLYKKHLKMGIIQAFQQSSLEHYNTSLPENQAFLLVFFNFFLPVLKREKGGKGKAEPLKPIFLLILEWMKLKKVMKNRLFHPLFPHFPSFSL